MDDFIVQLGWDDKKALQGLKEFLSKIRAENFDIKPSLNPKSQRKAEEARAKAESSFKEKQMEKTAKLNEEMRTAHYKEIHRDEKALNKARETAIETRSKAEAKAQSDFRAKKLREAKEDELVIKASDKRVAKEKADLAAANAERARRADVSGANKTKTRRFADSDMMQTISRQDPRKASAAVKAYHKNLTKATLQSAEANRHLVDKLRRTAVELRRVERASKRTSAAQRGLGDSTNHLIRSYASVFALMAGTAAINKTGQSFEALNSAMLAAMGTTEEANEQIANLDKLTDRLGLSLLDTADQYTKFVFASKGKLPTEEVNLLFEGMAELGTTLGVSKERMKLSFTAIQQMMNKSTISSEELKRQFAESMPGGIRIFADALGIGTKELLAQVESGKLLAEDVLPKVARQMKKVAAVGLEQKMLTARVAQGKFFKELESSQNLIFKSGFGEGVGEMFNEIASSMRESSEGMKGLGQMFKLVFKIIGELAEIVIPILDSMFYVLGAVSEKLIDTFSTNKGKIVGGIGAITVASLAMSSALAQSNFWLVALLRNFLKILAPIIAVAAVLEDLIANFDSNKISSLEKSLGYQLNMEKEKKVTEYSPAVNRIIQEGLDPKAGGGVVSSVNRFAEKVVDKFLISVFIDGTETAARKQISQQASQSQVEGR
jgi:tape measure domain-containing protein